jgi:hypothetical protein
MQVVKNLSGGGAMDRKELLLKLCQKLYDAVGYLYGEDSGLRAHLGESLMWFGGVFSKIGWILIWGEEQEVERMFKVIEDTIEKIRNHKVNSSLEQWLYVKLLDIEREIDKRLFPQEEEEQNPEPPQTQTETDELPF